MNLKIQKLKVLPKIDPLLPQWQEDLAKLEPVAVLNWAQVRFSPHLVLATSLGQEDQVLTDMLAQVDPEVRIVTLDTGRLFTETYELIERTEHRYGIKIELFSPDSSEVESMVRQHGVNLFRQGVDLRKLCCSIRKLHPLERALQGSEAWICGLRREQSVTRQEIQVIEWDEANGIYKINPLWNWTDRQTREYIKDRDVPYNPLHDQGYVSIGCSCCTRAVVEGEDIRAGRWWWENPEHWECGLHRNGDSRTSIPIARPQPS